MGAWDATFHKRLQKAVQTSRTELDPFLKNRETQVKAFRGTFWGGQKTDPSEGPSSRSGRVPIIDNLFSQIVDIHINALAANRPRVLTRSPNPRLGGFSSVFEMALNKEVARLGLEHTLRRLVTDAFFLFGVCRVGLVAAGKKTMPSGIELDAGQVSVEAIDPEDFICDMSAATLAECAWMGVYHRMTMEDLKGVPGVDTEGLEKIKKQASASRQRRSTGERVESLYDEVELIDIYVAKDRRVYTVDKEVSLGQPLYSRDWEGPGVGPFRVLGFQWSPGSPIPIAPSHNLQHLVSLYNQVYRKQAKQANRQKTVLAVESRGKDDGKRVTRARDGESITVDNLENTELFQFPGADPATTQFGMKVGSDLDRAAGNIKALGGLGPVSRTFSQDQLVQESASERLNVMRSSVVDFLEDILRVIAWELWNDPVSEIAGYVDAEGTLIDEVFRPGDREGEFADYELEIDPHSLPFRSPERQLQQIMSFIGQVYTPLADLFAQTGVQLDAGALAKSFGSLAGVPQLYDFMTFGNPPVSVNASQSAGLSGTEPATVIQPGGPSLEELLTQQAV